uniref:Uncharacterized protein n=1 Tax=Ascaris lumbricoides TaxID=6252 RepID=A0A0M3IUN4_ASCLU
MLAFMTAIVEEQLKCLQYRVIFPQKVGVLRAEHVLASKVHLTFTGMPSLI